VASIFLTIPLTEACASNLNYHIVIKSLRLLQSPGIDAIVLLGVIVLGPLLLCPDLSAAEWSAIAGAKTLYTDNVYELSASRRLELAENPSQPIAASLTRLSDVVWEPSIDVRRTTSSALGSSELSFKADGFLYTNNPIFNHGDYRAQLHQQVASNTWLLLRYRYAPNLFLGPNFERQSGTRLLTEERVTEHAWRMHVEQKLNDRWTATLVGRYGLRFYNEVFSERDTEFYTIGSSVQLRATSWAALTLDYLYEIGLADGRNEPQFKDDVSYRQHFVSLGTRFRLTEPLSLELTYAYRRKQFTSSVIGDPFRGTMDNLHQGTAEVHYNLSAAARFTVGFQRTQRSSSLAVRDFFNTNTSLALQYRF
jgi:opacity protein-like surface antigen